MKCLFDNNMPIKLAKALNLLEGEDGIVVKHLMEQFPSDTSDITWVEELKKDGGWFVITKDNQIRKKPHERKAWQESNIPIVFLPKSWVKLSLWEMAWRLIKYWPELTENIVSNKKTESFELAIQGKITMVR